MCGRYSFFETDQLYERFDVELGKEKIMNHYNVAPSQIMPTITSRDEKKVTMLQWGITPKWVKEGGRGLINARAESVLEKPTFKKLAMESRCLIPAMGWFEWKKVEKGKQPYYFHRIDEKMMAFAGICDDDEYSILTTEAYDGLEKVHHRMPLVLPINVEKEWLNSDIAEPEKIEKLLETVDIKKIDFYEVGKKVNNAGFDEANIIEKKEN